MRSLTRNGLTAAHVILDRIYKDNYVTLEAKYIFKYNIYEKKCGSKESFYNFVLIFYKNLPRLCGVSGIFISLCRLRPSVNGLRPSINAVKSNSLGCSSRL